MACTVGIFQVIMKILLITPPLVQSNTPYPATPYLTGILQRKGFIVEQADASLMLLLRLFSAQGLDRIALTLRRKRNPSPIARFFLTHADNYRSVVEPAIRFLQNKDTTLGFRIASRSFLPEGPRFDVLRTMNHAGIEVGVHTEGIAGFARFLASLFIDDLADLITDSIDPRFGLARYAESLGLRMTRFEPLTAALNARPGLVDSMIDEIAEEFHARFTPSFVGLTIPFPGTLYAALRISRVFKTRDPGIRIAIGGGYVTTELRNLAEPAIFDTIDYACLDDGAQPLLAAIGHSTGRYTTDQLIRCFTCENGTVHYHNAPSPDVPKYAECGPPVYTGLPLTDYFGLTEMSNPMHTLWSSGRWNKLMLAHGCYWRACRFCDTSLDYIRRYDPAPAAVIVDWIEAIIAETGESGFHFVDEAMPPALIRAISEELLRRRLVITWWGNIRFEKNFDSNLAGLMAQAGCIAVSGGLEAAHDRLLTLINKGITVASIVRTTHALSSAGIMVHAYCMYGIPSETAQETVDSLEVVRQLFAAGCLRSAFWHRFAATAHSTIGTDPETYGIHITAPVKDTFACNDLTFSDDTGVDHDQFGAGLKKAAYNFMHGVGVDEDVRTWFDEPVPPSRVKRSLVPSILKQARREQ
jgi:hypothetical protein